MVEHYVRNVGVAGSNPVISTMNILKAVLLSGLFCKGDLMNIAVLEPLGIPNQDLAAQIFDACENIDIELELSLNEDRREDPESLVARAQDAEIVVVSNIPFPASVMEQLPKLRYICCAFTGYDHIDMDYCREHDITVANCAGYSTTGVAEIVMAFAVMLGRNLVACDKAVREGRDKTGLVGPELENKRFGIIGCGAIGTRVAQLAQAFGCEVVAYNRSKKEVPGVTFTSLEEVLSTSDIISLHVPSNAETAGMLSAEQFALCKPTAYFINCARGPIVDSQALANALNEGRLAGAAVDVFEMEPPIPAEHPLLNAKNLIATPHVAFASDRAFEKRASIVAENIASYLLGTPSNVVA